MFKSLFLTSLMVISISGKAQIFNLGRSQDQIFSPAHGYDLPKKVGKKAQAKSYRQQYMDQMGVSSFIDELGITQFSGNDNGLALIKKGNTDEGAFLTVLNQRNYKEVLEWKNGPEFIEVLKRYTSRNGCIPKITSVSHGWISEDRPGEGDGLSGNKGTNGIFATEGDLPTGFKKFGSRSLQKDMKEAVDSGEIQFCGRCVVQFYACNISAKFASTFAAVSGCQAVVATGMNSPIFQSDNRKVYAGAHYWKSDAGVWAERHTDAQRARGERLGSWYRATPVKDASGRVRSLVEENLGKEYIAL